MHAKALYNAAPHPTHACAFISEPLAEPIGAGCWGNDDGDDASDADGDEDTAATAAPTYYILRRLVTDRDVVLQKAYTIHRRINDYSSETIPLHRRRRWRRPGGMHWGSFYGRSLRNNA